MDIFVKELIGGFPGHETDGSPDNPIGGGGSGRNCEACGAPTSKKICSRFNGRDETGMRKGKSMRKPRDASTTLTAPARDAVNE